MGANKILDYLYGKFIFGDDIIGGSGAGSLGGFRFIGTFLDFATLNTTNPASSFPGRYAYVMNGTGVIFVNRKRKGLYYSDGATWTRSKIETYFSDTTFEIYNSLDPTKKAKLDSSLITTGLTRTYQFPNKNGTLALLTDTAPNPINTVWVSKNGSDIIGDGTFKNPYLTIKYANDNTTADATNRKTILVASGVYAEDPIIMKQYLSIIGMDMWTTKITPNNINSPLFTIAPTVTLQNFIIVDVTNSQCVYDVTGDDSQVVRNLCLDNSLDGIKTSGLGTIPTCYDIILNSGLTRGFYTVNSGKIKAFNTKSDAVTTLQADSGEIYIFSLGVFSGTNALYANGGEIDFHSVDVHNCTNIVRLNNAGKIEGFGLDIHEGCTKHIWQEDTLSETVIFSAQLDQDKIDVQDITKINIDFNDVKPGAEGLTLLKELHVGMPENGYESVFGEGDSYTRGMIVLTTDNTATSATEGGNITDVSANALSVAGSTFTFQGVSANHTIMIGSSLQNSDYLKHWGIKVVQTIAAAEVTPKSFVFEIWDGAAWVVINTMSNHSSEYYKYGNSCFIRSNLTEHVRYGITNNTTWIKKLVAGNNLYWSRIRIGTTVTTLPVFEQFKLHCSRFEANPDGTNTYHGRARFRQTILATGNIFGESGGVTSALPSIGSGGIPTGWTHRMKNTQLNGDGDAIYLQFSLPKAIDTSHPLFISVKYQPEQAGASTDASIIISTLPIEIQDVLTADPAGGINPVNRSLVNTEAVTTNVAQVTTISAPIVDETKIQTIESNPVDISNYYEGDMVAIRIELDAAGSANKDIFVWAVEISGVKWTHGDKI